MSADDASLSSLFEQAKLPERTVPVCLRGDLQAQLEDLQRTLAAERTRETTSLGEVKNTEQIEAQIAALDQQMGAATVVFRLRALARKQRVELIGKHPPRKGNQLDHTVGYNRETFEDALIITCTTEPAPTAEEWARLFDEVLTAAQYQKLLDTAVALNFRDNAGLPFRRAANSSTPPNSGENSKRPARGGSRGGAGTGGSRAKRPATSTTRKEG